MSDLGDVPIDDLLDPVPARGADPELAYDGGWEQALEEGDGFEDRPPGDEPTLPEL
jgi:hypothetical protein